MPARDDTSTVFQARRLSVVYGHHASAVDGVDLDVTSGEVAGLIGPDGAGKTSTLRVLAGLQRASDGDVRAFGEPVWASRRQLHHRIGYLAQRFALYGDLTVDENVRFFGVLYGISGWRQRRDELLERVGLAEFRTRLADRLSGGMKQKLALACTLMHAPEVLVLDEPTTGVDPVTRRELWRLLGELVRDGLTLLVATPYLDEAERCQQIFLMHHGHVVASGSPSQVRALLPGQLVEVDAEPRRAALDALRNVPDVADASVFGSRLHARVRADVPFEPLCRQLNEQLQQHQIRVNSIRPITPTLEDAFLALTSTQARSIAFEETP